MRRGRCFTDVASVFLMSTQRRYYLYPHNVGITYANATDTRQHYLYRDVAITSVRYASAFVFRRRDLLSTSTKVISTHFGRRSNVRRHRLCRRFMAFG
ncbi:hypothetical protein Csa_008486 [Cucumis sativus]|uniref:Uncharacterized protein n=1 Tax=Cucumis sativus TaxID=3659 RepID=A0A0A0KTL3_CUCSA|nr:hypothetical protein Csa_008486 [Cucumis sativus]